MSADVYIKITYNTATDDFEPLETNLKPERVDEILAEWLRTQLGQGGDDTPPAERKQYHITIGVDLSDDTFFTKSDTNNKALTCGLIMHLVRTRRAKCDCAVVRGRHTNECLSMREQGRIS